MKYTSTHPPIECLMRQSNCYKGSHNMVVKGVLWHDTGANNTALSRYVQPDDNATDRAKMLSVLGTNKYGNDWNHINRDAGVNFFIGKLANGEVTTVKVLPDNMRPWGCGSGSKGSLNNGWVQFEICADDYTNADYFNKVYKEACELTAYLCVKFGIDPLGKASINACNVPTITCHYDSYKMGFGSNHGDVLSWFKKHGKTMDDVRRDVANIIKGGTAAVNPTPAPAPTPTPAPTPAPTPTPTYQCGIYKITASSLNVRKGTATTYGILGSVKNGALVTVTEVRDGWGKVAYGSSMGWISLKYGEYIKTTAYTAKVSTSLNIRSGAGTSYGIVGKAKNGDKIPVVSISGEWAKVVYSGKYCYCSSKYLTR